MTWKKKALSKRVETTRQKDAVVNFRRERQGGGAGGMKEVIINFPKALRKTPPCEVQREVKIRKGARRPIPKRCQCRRNGPWGKEGELHKVAHWQLKNVEPQKILQKKYAVTLEGEGPREGWNPNSLSARSKPPGWKHTPAMREDEHRWRISRLKATRGKLQKNGFLFSDVMGQGRGRSDKQKRHATS